MNNKEVLSYFQLEIVKHQLEESLESTGPSSRDSVKLLLQYSSMLAQYSKQLMEEGNLDKAEQMLRIAFSLMLPNDPQKALMQYFQYWRLLITITIEFYLVLVKTQKTQQGMNAMLSVYNLLKQKLPNKSIQLYNEQDLLCFHIAMAWDQLGDNMQASYMANEAVLMLQNQLSDLKKNRCKTNTNIHQLEKKIRMLIQLLDLQAKNTKDTQRQIKYFEMCAKNGVEYLGKDHVITKKYQRKLQSKKAQLAFEQQLNNLDDLGGIPKKRITTEIEFDIEDEQQDLKILNTMQPKPRPKSSVGLSSSALPTQNIPTINSFNQKNKGNIYYLFSNFRNKKTREDTVNQTNQSQQATLQSQYPTQKSTIQLSSKGSQQNINFYHLMHRRIVTETSRQDTTKSYMNYSRFKTDESEDIEQAVRQSFINNLMIPRPSQQYSIANPKKIRTVSPPVGKDQTIEGSSDKRKRIREFDQKRKYILLRRSNEKSRPSEQIPESVSKPGSATIIIRPPSLEKSEDHELEAAAIKIQKFYRKRRTLRLSQQDPQPSQPIIQLSKNQSFVSKHEAYSQLSQSEESSDSLNRIMERDAEEETSPVRTRHFHRSTTVMDEEQQGFVLQHASAFQLPNTNMKIGGEKNRKLNQMGRSSARLVIHRADKVTLQLPQPKRASHLSSQKRSFSHESDDLLFPSNTEAVNSSDHIDVLQQQFSLLTFYLNYHDQGNKLWRINAMEGSVIMFKQPSLNLNDGFNEKEKQVKPQSIQLIIWFETQFFRGPITWKISYDKKLFRLRKENQIFKFADGVLGQFIQEYGLSQLYSEQQNQNIFAIFNDKIDDYAEEFMSKLYFLLQQFTYLKKEVNGRKILICDSSDQIPDFQKNIQRCKTVRKKKLELLSQYRTVTCKLQLIAIPDRQVEALSKRKKKKIQLQKGINQVVFAVKTTKQFVNVQQSRRQSELENVHIPLISIRDVVTEADEGAIGKNESDSLPNNSQRDKNGTNIKRLLSNGFRPSDTIEIQGKRRESLRDGRESNIRIKKEPAEVHSQSQFQSPILPQGSPYRLIRGSQSNNFFKITETEEPETKKAQLNKVKSVTQGIVGFSGIVKNTMSMKMNEARQMQNLPVPSTQSDISQLKRVAQQTLDKLKVYDDKKPSLQRPERERGSVVSAQIVKEMPTDPDIQSELKQIEQPTIPLSSQSSIQASDRKDEVFYSKGYFEVSPQWKRQQSRKRKIIGEYKFDTIPTTSYKPSYCYTNPFPQRSLLMICFLKKDSTLFQVTTHLNFKKDFELLNSNALQQKDVGVDIKFTSFDLKFGSKSSKVKSIGLWDDQISIFFRDFQKWFVGPSFQPHEFVAKGGFTEAQIIEITKNLQLNIQIQDCKLKIEYFKENEEKKAKRKYERKDFYLDYVMLLEQQIIRDYGFKQDNSEIMKQQDPFFLPYYQTLLDKRMKFKRTKKRILKRAIIRSTKKSSLTSVLQNELLVKQEIGPYIVQRGDDDTKHIQVTFRGNIEVPLEMKKDLLINFNTIRILKRHKYVFTFNSLKKHQYYVVWKQIKTQLNEFIHLRVLSPFSKQGTLHILLSSYAKEKIINLFQISSSINQERFKDIITEQMLTQEISLVGRRLRQVHKQSWNDMSKLDQTLLSLTTQYHSLLTEDTYRLHYLTKISLLQSVFSEHSFWKPYFKYTQRMLVGYVRGIGKCFMQFHILTDLFEKRLISGLNRQIYIRVDLYRRENMRSLVFKLVFSTGDIQNLFGKKLFHYEITTEPSDMLVFQLRSIICQHIIFQRVNLYKSPKVEIVSRKSRNIDLRCNFQWEKNYKYNDYSFRPYEAKDNFFNEVSENPINICHIPTFIHLPIPPSGGTVVSNTGLPKINFRDEYPQQTACIFSISVSKEIKCFFIQLYFSKSQRKFIAQLNFSDIKSASQNQQLDFWVKSRCGMDERKQLTQRILEGKNEFIDVQLWVAVSRTFRVQINEQNKLLLHIPIFETICVFQESLLHRVKRLNCDKEEALFSVHIVKNGFGLPGPITHLSLPQRKIRIIESPAYNLFIKIQWLHHQERMQASKLPFPELLMGYYKKYINDKTYAMHEYQFTHSDLISLSNIVIEMIVLNWQSNKLDLQEVLPLESTTRSTIKTNASVSLRMAFVYQEYISVYSSQLLNKPPTMITIFLHKVKDEILFYIQRLEDCSIQKKIIPYGEVENLIPGFRAQLAGSKYELGRKLYLLFKNRMILTQLTH